MTRALLVVVPLFAAACAGSGSGGALSRAASDTNLGASSGATATKDSSGATATKGSGGYTTDDPALAQQYGYSAQKNAAVTYQPDVVVIPNGAAAVRSVSANGLVWTMDAAAPGIKDLKVGSVMFATSEAVGRVAAITDAGATRVVTLAPVQLTEVVRNGTMDFSRKLDASAFIYQHVPDLPGAISQPDAADVAPAAPDAAPTTTIVARSAEGGVVPLALATPAPAGDDGVITVSLPALRLGQVHPAETSGGLQPPPQKSSIEVPIGDWKVKPSIDGTKLGLGVSYKASENVKLGVDFAFTTKDLSIDSAVTIADGQVTKSGFVINGITGLDVSVSAGVANGSVDNSKVKIEVPVEVNAPIPASPVTAGLPVNIKVTYKFIIEMALTGKNSTLVAQGKYGLDGPIGVSGGTAQIPTFTVKQSIIDSISGITIGPSGLVVAVNMKLLAGIGTSAATVGPYGSVTVSLGLTNGSALGASLARCHSATLDITGGVGVGLSVSTSVADALRALLPAKTKIDIGFETKTSLLHRSQVVPDVPLCRG